MADAPGQREQIASALLSLLGGTGKFTTVSRRLADPEGLDPSASPALFLVMHEDIYRRDVIAAPRNLKLHAMAIIYNDVGSGQPDAIPESFVNNALDALDGLLRGENPLLKKNTLGGLVEACFIEGTVVRASGDVTGKAMAQVPITIILP